MLFLLQVNCGDLVSVVQREIIKSGRFSHADLAWPNFDFTCHIRPTVSVCAWVPDPSILIARRAHSSTTTTNTITSKNIKRMPLADKDFPSSQAFDLIEQVLQDQETRSDMMKSANAIFGFDLTSPDGSRQVFLYIIRSYDNWLTWEGKLVHWPERGRKGRKREQEGRRSPYHERWRISETCRGKGKCAVLHFFWVAFDTSLDLYSCRENSR